MNVGLLARILRNVGRRQEAEPLLREVIQRSVERGQYRTAGVAVGDLLNLLVENGRLEEALTQAEEQAGYTRLAGLGPWTQLGDECQRLNILNVLGRYDEVLDAVKTLWPKLAGLSEQGEWEKSAKPLLMREALLDKGMTAAIRSNRHELALALNAEIVKYTKQRGASKLELAQARFNGYFPLLSLGRHEDARRLLVDFRLVCESEHYIIGLSKVWSALAHLAYQTGDGQDAVRFEEIALGYTYQTGQPEDCAISHNNLANYLQHLVKDAKIVLAHDLAATTMGLQMQLGHLRTWMRNLASTELQATPPSFDSVADIVEQVEGVRFRDLFEQLPRTVPDGDTAIATVWQMVLDMQQQ